MSEEIPVVIQHLGDQLYFINCVNINAKYNNIIVIGNETNIRLFKNPKVQHVHMNTLYSEDEDAFRNYWSNYSSNSEIFEFLCFQRIFVLKQLMLKRGFKKVFYLDSDCLLLENTKTLLNAFGNIDCAVSVVKSDKPYNMTACIHNSILTVEFCDVFIQLCKDIYQNKSKYHLIKNKWDWHRSSNTPGGICDMTLYYLIVLYKMVPNICDLNETRIFKNEICVFDHNVSIAYGFLGDHTFQLNSDNSSKIVIRGGYHYYALLHTNQPIRLLSIHYQGNSKVYLQAIDVDKF